MKTREPKPELKIPAGIRKRNGLWHWRFETNGNEYTGSTHLRATARNLPTAIAIFENAKVLIKTGRESELRIKAQPFSSAAELFILWAKSEKKAPSTAARLATSTASLKAWFKATPCHLITAGEIEDYKCWRRDSGIKEVTLANDIAALKQLLDYAILHGWTRRNPCQLVKKPSRKAHRMFILSPAEEARYFAAARKEADLYDLGRLILQQGCRPGELLKLRWESVDLFERTIHVSGKTPAATRTLNLTPEAFEILTRRWQGRKAIDDEYVFLGKDRKGNLKTTQRAQNRVLAAVRKADLKEAERTGVEAPPRLSFVVYDLRHTFATRMANGDERNGFQPYAALPVLKEIMGHTRVETTMIYVKRSPQAMQKAMERYGAVAKQPSILGPDLVRVDAGNGGK